MMRVASEWVMYGQWFTNRVQSALVFLMGEEDEWCEGSTRLCHSLEALSDLIADFTDLTVT